MRHINAMIAAFSCFALGLAASPLVAECGEELPELVSVKRIWDEGRHNAFTDLIRYQDRWYCTFREGDDHVGGDGRIRVLVSDDGDQWESAALLSEEGIDLRDPKLSTTADGRLMIVAGGSVYEGSKVLKGRQPRVSFSADGRNWTTPRRILSEGDWLWRVTWHDGKAYGVTYRITPAAKDQDAQLTASDGLREADEWLVRLVASEDGVEYETVTQLAVPDRPNETTVRILDSGEMLALIRREKGNTRGWIGVSKPPYQQWSFSETEYRLGGPNFIELPTGELWAGTRNYVGSLKSADARPGASTVLCRMTRTALKPVLLLPSGGDTSYPGLVWDEGLLWMSYYSSHEGKTSIYLAKIKLPE